MIFGMAARSPAMQKLILGFVAANLLPAIAAVGGGSITAGEAISLGIQGYRAVRGITTAMSVAKGLVRAGGGLERTLLAIEKEWAASSPKTIQEGLIALAKAAKAAGMPTTGIYKSGGLNEKQYVLQNAGGIITIINDNGSIIVKRGIDVLLQIEP
jgi:hypothetical protein